MISTCGPKTIRRPLTLRPDVYSTTYLAAKQGVSFSPRDRKVGVRLAHQNIIEVPMINVEHLGICAELFVIFMNGPSFLA